MNALVAWVIAHLLGSVTLIVILGAATEYAIKRAKRAKRGTPTRAQLDAEDNAPPANGLPVLWLLGELAAAGVWCIYEGRAATDALLFKLETFTLWWGYVAEPRERVVLVVFLALVAVAAVLVWWLLHRVVWRTFFPNLVRLDAHGGAGGLAEPVGRLFAVRPFTEEAGAWVRLYYKHGFRIMPPFAFDKLDLPADAKPEPFGLGTVAVRCGRIERDMARGRRYRRAAGGDYAAAPLAATWREEQTREARARKVSIVLTGASMNPETTRRKFEREATITRMEARGLDALRKARKRSAQPVKAREAAPDAPAGGE